MKKIITLCSILGCILFLLFGGIFLAVGIAFNFYEKDFLENGVPIIATVTDISEETDSHGEIDTSTYITFEYNGKTYTDIDLKYSSSSLFVGKEIEIYFKPSNGDVMYIKGNKMIKIVFIAVGSFICFLGICILVVGFIIARAMRTLKDYM